MSQAPARPQTRRPTLNADGKRHTLLYAGAAYTVVAGVIALVLGLMNVVSTLGAALGVTGFLIGMIAQMMSATRAERMFIVVGITASFVGMGLGIAHGGF
ncbi:MAG: hypothetical protein ACR2FU_14595 [Streptosporangiaceae bacterium]